MKLKKSLKTAFIVGSACLGVLALGDSIIKTLSGTPQIVASTVPATGDVNPYGVAFVPPGFHGNGSLNAGDILVSNFNASSNLQGTGTTIMRVTPTGSVSVFWQGPKGVGLTTALGILKGGYVIVGNIPSPTGSAADIAHTSLIVLNADGEVVNTFSDNTLLAGPWDLTVNQGGDPDDAQVFVSNALDGTVTRLDLEVGRENVSIQQATQVASGYINRTDPNAFLIGPTGLVFDAASDRLYVASTGDNAVFAVDHASKRNSSDGIGSLVYKDNAHLRGPLGLVLCSDGHFITANGDAVNGNPAQPSELVEFTENGHFVGETPVNASGQGGAFGVAVSGEGDHFKFAAVDDIANQLDIWDVKTHDHDGH